MASLVLGAVGAVVGAYFGQPQLGWAIGSAIGSAIDAANKDAPHTTGPRLSDLKLQQSTYGAPIPRPYGSIRIAGNVIWQTDLIEHEETKEEEGGKGGDPPTTTTFRYTASFAVLLCEGPIYNVRKIWADNRFVFDGTDNVTAGSPTITERTLLDPTGFTTDDWNYHVRHPETWGMVELTDFVFNQRNAYGEGGINYDATWTDDDYTGAFVTGEGTVTAPDLPRLPFTLYIGDESQGPDPTMEADLGVGNVPAYRGRAYIVFTDLDLTDYFNRIPSLSFEILTRGGGNGVIRTLLASYDQPIVWAGGIPRAGESPIITSWPLDGTSFIRVRNILTDGTAHETVTVRQYRQSDLTYVSDATYDPALDGWPSKVPLSSPGVGFWTYYPVGYYRLTANTVYLYGSTAGAVGSNIPPLSTVKPTVIVDAPYGEGGFPEGNDLCLAAGIPEGEYVGGAVLSSDGRLLFVFTAPTPTAAGGAVVDKWYKLVNGLVIDHGTCSPLLATSDLAWGRGEIFPYDNANVFENNGRYMWHSNAGNTVKVYSITDDNVFEPNAVCNAHDSGAGPGTGEPVDVGQFFSYPSLIVPREGYAGLVVAGSVVYLTRLPLVSSDTTTLGEIVSDLSERAGLSAYDVDQLTDVVDGYIIANQMTVRAAIEPLQHCYFFDAVESDNIVKFVKRTSTTAIVTIPDDDLAAHAAGDSLPPLLASTRVQEVDLPATVSVVYLNSEADYQLGTQVARRMVTESREARALELPLVLTAAKARHVADSLLFNAHLERTAYTFSTTRKYARYEPCDVIQVRDKRLRINKKVEERGVIKFGAAPMLHSIFDQSSVGAEGGFVDPIVAPGMRTTLHLLDIPLLPGASNKPTTYMASGGSTVGAWPGAVLYKSTDDGVSYAPSVTDTTADTFGSTFGTLPDFFGGNVFDESSTVTVVLSNGAASLASATETSVLNGANAALIGSEIIQYKNAELTAANTYVLSGLLRGRLGTEWAMATHTFADRFVRLTVGLQSVPITFAELNQPRLYKAVTLGQTVAGTAAQSFTNTGIALRPYAPVHLGGGSDADGNTTLNWVRRTRAGGEWTDGADALLSETVELYVVQIWDASYSQVARIFTGISLPTLIYTSAMQIADFGNQQQTVFFTVTQVGALLGRIARGSAAGVGGSNDLPLTPIPEYATASVPPPSGGSANLTLTWPVQEGHTAGFTIGSTYVVAFTTGATTPGGYIAMGEYVDPPTLRYAVLSTDTAGVDILARSYGNTVSIFFGAGAGYAALDPLTTYYFVVRAQTPAGDPSGIVGTSCNGLVRLAGS